MMMTNNDNKFMQFAMLLNCDAIIMP